jgi:hypothetical protein
VLGSFADLSVWLVDGIGPYEIAEGVIFQRYFLIAIDSVDLCQLSGGNVT